MDAIIKLLLIALAIEAVVELIKKAAPVQPIRLWLIKATPFLYSRSQGTHLLECPYCMSVWVGIALYFLYSAALWVIVILCVHRMSNYIHLIFSIIRDRQLDIRVNRGKQ